MTIDTVRLTPAHTNNWTGQGEWGDKMIYFVSTIQSQTFEIIKEARDCADVLRDLNQIEQAKANLSSGYGTVLAANQLDRELRQKYPTIDMMLNIANTMRPPSPQVSRIQAEVDKTIANLNQDYCGILCDTAVKKGLAHSIKDCIKSVD